MKKRDNKGIYQGLALVTQLGITIITSIFLGLFIGRFIDKKVGTEMIFTLIFLVIGAGGGILNIVKLANGSRENRK